MLERSSSARPLKSRSYSPYGSVATHGVVLQTRSSDRIEAGYDSEGAWPGSTRSTRAGTSVDIRTRDAPGRGAGSGVDNTGILFSGGRGGSTVRTAHPPRNAAVAIDTAICVV